jgi:hypothetical protein
VVTDARALADDEIEEVDALPVLAEPRLEDLRESDRRGVIPRPSSQFVAQAAAVAVTSFAAGAVATAVARHVKAGRAARRPPRRELARGIEIVSSRTLLVDVHVLGRSE